MLSSLLLAATPLLAHGLNHRVGRREAPDLVHLPLQRVNTTDGVSHLARRQYAIADGAILDAEIYAVNVAIGSEQDIVALFLDTGSAEIWVNPVCENTADPELCYARGRYGVSDSVISTGETGSIDYTAASVEFDYVDDSIEFLGLVAAFTQRFGNATDSSAWTIGVFGMAPAISRSNPQYPLFIDNVVETGIINNRLFTLDIHNGNMLYGAIDTKHYSGPFEPLPIIPASDSPDGTARYWIRLDALAIAQENGSEQVDIAFDEDEGQTVLLTTGYGATLFPSPIFRAIASAFPTAAETDSGVYEVDCDLNGVEGSIGFTFGKTTIEVPFQRFVRDTEEGCFLSIIDGGDAAVLGTNFLSSAYAVHDLDSQVVLLAQADNCGTNAVILEFGSEEALGLEGECGSGETTQTPIITPTSDPEPTTASETSTSTEPTTISETSLETSLETSSETDASQTPVIITPSSEPEPTTILETTSGDSSSTAALTSTRGAGNRTSISPTTMSTTTLSSTTEALTSTKTYVVTSCPPVVTDCPYGTTTTETIISYTTYCPQTETGPVHEPSTTHILPPPPSGSDCPGNGPCDGSKPVNPGHSDGPDRHDTPEGSEVRDRPEGHGASDGSDAPGGSGGSGAPGGDKAGDDDHSNDTVSPPSTGTKGPSEGIETPITGSGVKAVPASFGVIVGALAAIVI